MKSPKIIAEIGCNHKGDMNIAKEMIMTAATYCKVDVVKLQDHAIATLSCKASLKGNTHLSNEGMQNIIDNLMRCDNPYVCPHGRPTLVYYSSYEIEKLFKRVA